MKQIYDNKDIGETIDKSFDAGIKEGYRKCREQMIEEAVECDVIVPIYEGNNVWSAKIKIPGRHEPGDKVKVIIIPEEK